MRFHIFDELYGAVCILLPPSTTVAFSVLPERQLPFDMRVACSSHKNCFFVFFSKLRLTVSTCCRPLLLAVRNATWDLFPCELRFFAGLEA